MLRTPGVQHNAVSVVAAALVAALVLLPFAHDVSYGGPSHRGDVTEPGYDDDACEGGTAIAQAPPSVVRLLRQHRQRQHRQRLQARRSPGTLIPRSRRSTTWRWSWGCGPLVREQSPSAVPLLLNQW